MKTILDPLRLITPKDEFKTNFPGMNFRELYEFETRGEPILITDPTYLSDVYNENDILSEYLKKNGVFLMEFGGDVGGPVWWQEPYIFIPVALGMCDEDGEIETPPGVIELGEVVTDSGSFIFLPVKSDLPNSLKSIIDDVIENNNGVIVNLPGGKWEVFYEQLEPDGKHDASWLRNIVVQWKPFE